MMKLAAVLLSLCVGVCFSKSMSRITGGCPSQGKYTGGKCSFDCYPGYSHCPGRTICCQNNCGGSYCACPVGTPMPRCFANPCKVTKCPAFPRAHCRANYCGGCNAFFHLKFWGMEIDVTDYCKTKHLLK